jgi:hypothetical protein
MSYEDAPATKMLATHCVICARPLRDALSAELGIGPVCREKHGWDAEIGSLTEEGRIEANGIIHRIAADPANEALRASGCKDLRALGFSKLAERIEYRGKDAPAREVVEVRPSTHGTGYYVRSPYRPVAVEAWRAIPGRKFQGETLEDFVPNDQRAALWSLLRRFYNGHKLVVRDVDRNVVSERTLEAA